MVTSLGACGCELMGKWLATSEVDYYTSVPSVFVTDVSPMNNLDQMTIDSIGTIGSLDVDSLPSRGYYSGYVNSW